MTTSKGLEIVVASSTVLSSTIAGIVARARVLA
jgi:hypothetical protein